MKRASILAGTALALGGGLAATTTAVAASAQREYVVLYERGASADAGAKAISAAGGTIVKVNRAVGVATVRSSDASFATDVAASEAVESAVANRTIGTAEKGSARQRRDAVERAASKAGVAAAIPAPAPGGDELSGLQWDMRAIGATPEGSYAVNPGSHAVRVGIMDTGIDGGHPDIAANFDRVLSRNFTVDDPVIDGPCAEDPNPQPADEDPCVDHADVDEDGHGTHVASTVGAPQNGIGISGVAPGVDLVNLRAGQDSGYFFLQPTVDALTYAGDHGIDVVNMSFYIDPWLFNCTSSPDDSPAEQAEQAVIIEATQRALTYARDRGVTLVSAEGNENTDLGNPTSDDTSPDYPGGTEKVRTIDNTCLNEPTEGEGVIGVSATGPSGRKSYYSDYGLEQTDVSAPGGDYYDFPGTPDVAQPANEVLAAYPTVLAQSDTFDDDDDDDGENPNPTPEVPRVDPATGEPVDPSVVRSCNGGGRCGYYQYLQGTSMASPHAAGVAALIVAARGTPDPARGGVGLAPADVEQALAQTATDTPCPAGGAQSYAPLPARFDAPCVGTVARNGFYGEGLVNALAAAQPPPPPTPPAPPAGGGTTTPPAATPVSPTLEVAVAATRITRVLRMRLVAQPGAKATVTCKGGGCPRGFADFRVGTSGLRNLAPRFKGRKLRPGARITILVQTPGLANRVFVLKIRSGRQPLATRAVR